MLPISARINIDTANMVTPIWIFGGMKNAEFLLPGSVVLLVMLGDTESVKKKSSWSHSTWLKARLKYQLKSVFTKTRLRVWSIDRNPEQE